MLNVHSGAEILIKREGDSPNQVTRNNLEAEIAVITPPMLSSEDYGLLNSILYAANDPSQIRQVMQCCNATSNQGDQAIAQHLVSLGEKFMLKKKYFKAGRIFTAARLMDPHLIEAYILCAETYVQRKQYEKAVKLLKRGIQNNPKNSRLLEYSASLAEFQGDYTRLVFFEKLMLKENPQDSHTYLNLLQLLTDHAKFEQFVSIAESLPLPTMTQRDLFRAYNLLVIGYDEMKLYEKALQFADAALEIKPKRLALWEAKANIYRKLGQNEKALKCLQQMVRIKPHAKKYNEDAYLFGKKHHLL